MCTLSGDYGKPRPAVIVQSDLFNEKPPSFVICPITSFLIPSSLFRILINPNAKNGLLQDSQIMIDKIIAIKSDKISKKIGTISVEETKLLNNALRLWLNLD